MTGQSPYHMRRGLYRSRKGLIFGVCRGLGNFTDISVFWIRTFTVIIFIFTGFFPIVVLYAVAALFMREEPVLEPSSPEDWEFYNSLASNRSMGIGRLKRKFDQLERRTRRMEDHVTAREFSWEERLQQGS